jgi:hypothetical protein
VGMGTSCPEPPKATEPLDLSFMQSVRTHLVSGRSARVLSSASLRPKVDLLIAERGGRGSCRAQTSALDCVTGPGASNQQLDIGSRG